MRLSPEFRKLAQESGFLDQKIGEQELQSFGEAIVRECSLISENYAGGSLPLCIALKIKESFGVKS